MDSFSQILSQCHLGSAKVMDPSVDNFYVCEEKVQFAIKQEPFDIEESNVGLVGDFLQGEEDSIDIEAYLALGRAEVQQNNHVDTTGDGILRQLEQGFASNHQQMLTHTPAPTPGAQPNQQPVHSVDQLRYATISNMPQQNTQAHVVEQAVPEYQGCWEIHSTSNSAASSPGLPTSGDSYNEEVQADSGTASGSGGGSQKRKRPVPSPGTHEYKQKRERNNIAVRKSREKTKTKNKELQDKVGELQEENTGLKKRVEGLAKELAVLRSLFTTTGKTPPSALDKAVK